MKTVSVVHLVPSFGCGGLERVIANVIAGNSLPHISHTVISLSSDISFSHALPSGTNCISVHKRAGKDLGAHLRVANVLRQIKADVLHTYNFATMEYHPIAKLVGVKIGIHADHGMGGDDKGGKGWVRLLFRKGVSYFLRHYVVVNDALKLWVINDIGVPASKVVHIPNGVPIPESEPLRHRLPKELRIVSIGRLASVKNHAALLGAIDELQQRYACGEVNFQIYCQIVGDGPLRHQLEARAAELPAPDNVSFEGEQADVLPFIHRADFLVLSSDYEAMPMVMLEALAASRPVVAPNVGGMAAFSRWPAVYLSKDNQPSNLVSTIIQAATKSYAEQAESCEEARRMIVEQFSLSRMSMRYHELYNQQK